MAATSGRLEAYPTTILAACGVAILIAIILAGADCRGQDAHATTSRCLVGGDGIPIQEFLLEPVEHWIRP